MFNFLSIACIHLFGDYSVVWCATEGLLVMIHLWWMHACVMCLGIIPIMWVELVISVLLIGLGVCLLVGINYVCKNLLLQLTKWQKLL